MGYGQSVRGTLRITPALTAVELREHPKLLAGPGEDREAYPVIRREFTQTDEGEITRITSEEIEVANADESFSRYKLLEHIQQMVSAWPGHTWTGHIYLNGEDGGQSAIVVGNGTVSEVSPKVVWPWGEVVDEEL